MRARHALVEASWSTVRQPGPIHAFSERIRARRGHQVAIVACARKLACMFWCLLTRGEDYAFAQPSLTRKKLRRLEVRAGARRYAPEAAGVFSVNAALRKAERELAAQAEAAYKRTVTDWQRTRRREGAPARHRGAHLVGRQAAKQRGRSKPPGLLFSSSSGPAPNRNSRK